MPTMTLCELPLTYRVRSLLNGRKKAIHIRAMEAMAVEVASYVTAEAPIVGRLGLPAQALRPQQMHDITVEYRVARMPDGVVRLVAPLESAAFVAGHFGPEQAGMALVRGPLSIRGTRDSQDEWCLGPPQGGRILASERGDAVTRLLAAADRLILVDGTLHAACSSPVVERKWGPVGTSTVVTMVAPQRLTKGSPPWSEQPGRMDAYARQHPQAVEVVTNGGTVDTLHLGSFEVIQEQAFVADVQWDFLRRAASMLLDSANSHEIRALAGAMIREEVEALDGAQAAVADWPIQRDPDLLRITELAVRALHGQNQFQRTNGLETTVTALRNVSESRGIMPLESRLPRGFLPLGGEPDRPGRAL